MRKSKLRTIIGSKKHRRVSHCFLAAIIFITIFLITPTQSTAEPVFQSGFLQANGNFALEIRCTSGCTSWADFNGGPVFSFGFVDEFDPNFPHEFPSTLWRGSVSYLFNPGEPDEIFAKAEHFVSGETGMPGGGDTGSITEVFDLNKDFLFTVTADHNDFGFEHFDHLTLTGDIETFFIEWKGVHSGSSKHPDVPELPANSILILALITLGLLQIRKIT